MDLRAFVERLRECGELRTIRSEIDWRYELGEIVRASSVPVLFENIKDYPGQRVFANGLVRPQTMAAALGMAIPATHQQLIKQLRSRVATPIAPTRVTAAAVHQNVICEEEVDLLSLPVPHWNEADAGRYIGTWHVNISRDPDFGTYNLGVYRMQVLGPRQATISTSPKSHLGAHLHKAEAVGQPLPTAVAIGVSEAVLMAAASGYPGGHSEYELAGGLQQESVEVVRCATIDLDVPADSEIVIEGFIHPGARTMDGPYLDYAGKATENPNAFLFEATRMSYRTSPIFRGAAVGHPEAEDLQLLSVLSEVGLFDFHGSRIRRAVQSVLLRGGMFRAFQWVGRMGPEMLKVAPFPRRRRAISYKA
jgi:phenacrylate decarboxylase